MTDLSARLGGFRADGNGWRARCPAHDDRNPSLSIAHGEGGRILLNCHAGCTFEQITRALGMAPSDFAPESRITGSSSPGPLNPTTDGFGTWEDCARQTVCRSNGSWTSAHPYPANAQGESLVVLRWDLEDGKRFALLSQHADGCWRAVIPPSLSRPGSRPLLVCGPIADADFVVVVEGERKAELLEQLGFAVATSSGGARSGHLSDWSVLVGRRVVVLPDADEPGKRFAEHVGETLRALGSTSEFHCLQLPGIAEGSGEDVIDWFQSEFGGKHAQAAEAIQKLLSEALEAPASPRFVDMRTVLRRTDLMQPPPVLHTGLPWFDGTQPYGGLAEGTIHTLGGEPGSGKTRVLLNLVSGLAGRAYRVAYLLGEMDRYAVARRLLSIEARVPATALARPDPDQKRSLGDAQLKLIQALRHLRVVESPVDADLVRQAARWGDVVVVDPLQAVRMGGRYATRAEEIEDLMRELVALAQQHGTVFIATSEIGKGDAGGARDLFSAFKGSSAIPQYSHACYFVEQPEQVGAMQRQRIRCLKQRDGQPADMQVWVAPDRARLVGDQYDWGAADDFA
jgi:putative DNA primase/helicase